MRSLIVATVNIETRSGAKDKSIFGSQLYRGTHRAIGITNVPVQIVVIREICPCDAVSRIGAHNAAQRLDGLTRIVRGQRVVRLRGKIALCNPLERRRNRGLCIYEGRYFVRHDSVISRNCGYQEIACEPFTTCPPELSNVERVISVGALPVSMWRGGNRPN